MLKLILSSDKQIILLELSFTYFKCMRCKGIEPATWFRSEVTGISLSAMFGPEVCLLSN